MLLRKRDEKKNLPLILFLDEGRCSDPQDELAKIRRIQCLADAALSHPFRPEKMGRKPLHLLFYSSLPSEKHTVDLHFPGA